MSDRERIAVLHVFQRMDRGGAETWIVNILRRIDRERFRFDFLVEGDRPGAYDDEIRALGARILPVGSHRRPLAFARRVREVIRANGPYDVMHSHVHHFSGVMLTLARWEGVPIRIAHSHNDLGPVTGSASPGRLAYYHAMKALVRRSATLGLAASAPAAASLFGQGWQDHWPEVRVINYGIDVEPFRSVPQRGSLKDALGMPPDAFVVGHVGSFTPQKHHEFLLRTFRALLDLRSDAWLLLVGDGPLRTAIESQIAQLDLGERVVLTGVRQDVPDLMSGAMDCFVFPSLFEGLGLVALEAQAAGLPCVLADTVPDEAVVFPNQVTQLPLSAGEQMWAQRVAGLPAPEPKVNLERLQNPAFSIGTAVHQLEAVYRGEGIEEKGRW